MTFRYCSSDDSFYIHHFFCPSLVLFPHFFKKKTLQTMQSFQQKALWESPCRCKNTTLYLSNYLMAFLAFFIESTKKKKKGNKWYLLQHTASNKVPKDILHFLLYLFFCQVVCYVLILYWFILQEDRCCLMLEWFVGLS